MQRPGWGAVRTKGTLGVAFWSVLAAAAIGSVGYGVGLTGSKNPPPPVPTITSSPPSPTTSTTATLAFTDAQSGVSFQCSLDSAKPGTCSSPKTYTGLADGSHTFKVTASANGVQSAAASATWTVNTVPPPAPALTKTPDDPTFNTSATFSFSDSQSGVTFECSLDGGGFVACSSGQGYGNLSVATHSFAVRALDAAGTRSSATTFTWTIVARGSFPVSGTVDGTFYPGGPSVPIDLSISNPYNFALTVTSVTVTVTGTSAPSCSASTNFTVVQNLATSVTVAAGQTQTLSQLGVAESSWPHVAMRETGTNQDACRTATVDFGFSAAGTKANQ